MVLPVYQRWYGTSASTVENVHIKTTHLKLFLENVVQ